MDNLQLDSTVVREERLVSTQIDNDIVILDTEKSRYYGTEVVGRRVWELIGSPTKVSSICDQLLNEFQVDRATCENEVLRFLNQLLTVDLISIV